MNFVGMCVHTYDMHMHTYDSHMHAYDMHMHAYDMNMHTHDMHAYSRQWNLCQAWQKGMHVEGHPYGSLWIVIWDM